MHRLKIHAAHHESVQLFQGEHPRPVRLHPRQLVLPDGATASSRVPTDREQRVRLLMES